MARKPKIVTAAEVEQQLELFKLSPEPEVTPEVIASEPEPEVAFVGNLDVKTLAELEAGRRALEQLNK